MSPRAKGPRLWLRPARHDATGRLTHAAAFVIIDRGRQFGTGCTANEAEAAEQALAAYLASKHGRGSGPRDPASVRIEDVIALYGRDIVPHRARPDQAAFRLGRLLRFFAGKTLADINGPLCRAFARAASTDATARRDLEDLRAAINHHRQEGLHDRIVSVVMPPRRPPRERWLDRSEAARLIWTAWRRPKCRHVARFILLALYTGRRASVVCGASFSRETGRPWVDLASGMLWPPERARRTKKHNPAIPLPARLLVHLRAWKRSGQRYVVEWSGRPIIRLDQTLRDIALEAGLGEDVTPHVLRHTAATWQMQAGTDVFEAGKYLGMTVRTLETTYAHHRPEHLSGARDAYQRHRQRTANRTREPKPNRKARTDA